MSAVNRNRILAALTIVFGNDSNSFCLPGSDRYQKDNGSYFSAFENELKPFFIAKPSNLEEVQALVRSLRPHVLAGSCRVAIRGTGHTPFAGSANIQDGVTIDLRNLKGIVLNSDKSTVEIAVGETWGTVYSELDKHGLATTGGRAGSVGVGGLILGGGLSIFSSRRGFVSDSVTEFTTVLASGGVVHAHEGENADLWVALKGGLNNFGIVTSITMRTFPAKDIWGGITYYPPDNSSQLFQRTCDFVENETDEDVHMLCSASYGFGRQTMTCAMYHTLGKTNPPALQRFTALQPQIEKLSSMRTSSHLGFCDELSKFAIDGMRYAPPVTCQGLLCSLG